MDRNDYSPAPWLESIEMRDRDHGNEQYLDYSGSLSSAQSQGKSPGPSSQDETLNAFTEPNWPFLRDRYNSDAAPKPRSFSNPWRTGFWVQFPALGIAALIGGLGL